MPDSVPVRMSSTHLFVPSVLFSAWQAIPGRSRRGCGVPTNLSHRPWQSLEYEPRAHRQFEKKDGTAVNPDRDKPEQLWKNDEGERARSHQKGRQHSPAGQRSRNESGLEPEIAEGRTAESGEYQAN